MGSFNTTTDAEGNFEFTDNIPGGNYTLTAQKAGYISISRSVTVIGPGSTTLLKYKMAQSEPPVVVDPAEDRLIEVSSNDGLLSAFIRANTFTENVEVSLTPTLGISSPIPTDDLLDANEAPLQTFRITPSDINYLEAVSITLPLTMPAQHITGSLEVVLVDIQSGAEQVVGTANIVGNTIVHDINIGGDYLIRARTDLVYRVETNATSEIIGNLGPDELPGTGTVFNFEDESVVEVEQGYSRDMIETIFRFTNTSRTLQYGLSKPSGTNTTITGFLPIVEERHVFSTSTGMVAAKVTQSDNNGIRNIGVGTETVLIDYRCRQTSTAHNNWEGVGYFFTNTGEALTSQQVNDYISAGVLPTSPPSCL
jgi:hypothetical protein